MTGLGIMGGIFDPIHNGHLAAAEAAREHCKLDRVIFVPAGNPPHRLSMPAAGAEDRYLLTALAVAGNPYFSVSRVELDRPGPSYAYDTVDHFRRLYKPERVYFITGMDAVLEVESWYRASDLMSLCRFIAVTRPGYTIDELARRVSREYLPMIEVITTPGINISSTTIRERLRTGRSINYLVPDIVADYILKEGLYVN
ncbi:MAG: nicotinate-nucleotide adenylyltransferase [bacterium]|jgi:nicotinate-nucleotide adenylyltransferase|nr:nicotinate-nucleotide adenylyltransferase [bacterium]MDD3804837.1 nicotinate-nucleotide adenylyltransferase [bacterium]MDD4558409.1 nicotinate-nucleotide adenylyltransferase [bacterium]